MAVGELQVLLELRLKDFADSGGYPVAWENIPFDPQKHKGKVWLRPYLLMAEESMHLLNGSDGKARGIYQIDVLIPLGEGRSRMTNAMDKLREYFPKGLVLKGNRVNAAVLSLKHGATTTDEPPHCKRRLDIHFLAFLAG